MKILLLGANGQVGFELARSLAPLGDLACATRNGRTATGGPCIEADLANADALTAMLHSVKPNIVVNAAAYTAVDRAEDEADIADAINSRALASMAAWARASNALVVHYSTDYVFGGSASQPYREDDATAPLGVYGHSKLAGEHALRISGCDHLILRTAWVFGARGRNFLLSMLKFGRERDQLRVVNDQRGAPTSARLIANATTLALACWQNFDVEKRAAALGTYHLCASGECTWYEFARSIFLTAQRCGLLEKMPEVVPITTAEYPTKARRPAYSVLDTSKFSSMFGLKLPHWETGVDQAIEELLDLTGNAIK